MSQHHDLVVVGAGWFGLAAAKIYLELHPNEDILVLESSGSCGGTWAEHRLYPGLKSNNLYDAYEYPDFPMTPDVYGVHPGQHIPGAALHRYLTDFAKKFGVFSRTRFHTKVESVEQLADGKGWKLQITSPDSKEPITTAKLILATGLTSTPNFPQYPGCETFKGPYFHAKDFCLNGSTVKTAKNAVVIGGAKSAYDVAYAYADEGVSVDMVIRPDGQGPVWISHPYVDFGLRLEKLLHVKFLTCFSPCPWGGEAGYAGIRNWLHGTAIGRWVVDKFWAQLTGGVMAQSGFNSHPETKKLAPWNSAFWTASALSIHNYPNNFWEMVRQGKIRVHVAKVDHLTEDSVHLSTGDILKADVVICSTGWQKESSLKYIGFPESKIGLPQSPEEQQRLIQQADEEILTRYPRLKTQPEIRGVVKAGGPYRLYRFIVPPTMINKRNFAFAGMISSVSTSVNAYSQALWISAFMDGKLDRIARTEDEVTHEVMLHTQWGKWRYPGGYGANLPDFAFDALPYTDLLLNDLGVNVYRKPSAFSELFMPYGPEDFNGMVDEWKEKHM